MALVMLPCDLPWWGSVQRLLQKLSNVKNVQELTDVMQRIYEICNVSLDPDEDDTDPQAFIGLLNFLDNEFTSAERSKFLQGTLPSIIKYALKLKELKPEGGLHFSLQQQADRTELNYNFVSSLLANAFFSTFPKRTDKSHPTLQNFNFINFFKHIQSKYQKAKLRSFFRCFDWLEEHENNSKGSIKILRQVMSSKEWLTIEDWLECTLPLCPVVIKHDGKLERADSDCLHVCFASSKLGGKVLSDGNSQECTVFATLPEMLCLLLNVEALEDNEVVTIENVRRTSRISDPDQKVVFTPIESPEKITVCLMDAEDYSALPLGQFEEDNILRELNKCLLAFQQKQSRVKDLLLPSHKLQQTSQMNHHQRRLSPIGESISSTNSECLNENKVPIITQDSCSTRKSISPLPNIDDNNLKVKLEGESWFSKRGEQSCDQTVEGGMFHNRRGRFIVLGSSGELLPIKRKSESNTSLYSSLESSEDEFLSAKTSLDNDSEEENFEERYNKDLETAEGRYTFAQRLKDALRRETSSYSGSTDSSYAVGISITGSDVEDHNINVRRGGSRGFMLEENSLDEAATQPPVQIDKRSEKPKNKKLATSKESNKSSEYSFSTDYSSELEEVYQQFSRWLEHPILETGKDRRKELDSRELAVVRFAGSLLKRTLSESFAGVPLTENYEPIATEYEAPKKSKLVLSAKSLSLELARHKHRLAAQLLSQISQGMIQNGLKPISTGNWGCGRTKMGDHQLKAAIQWLAASVAGAPALIYHTCGHEELSALDTLIRILRDRKWCVKDLTEATLRYSNQVLHGRNDKTNLFEELKGVERST